MKDIYTHTMKLLIWIDNPAFDFFHDQAIEVAHEALRFERALSTSMDDAKLFDSFGLELFSEKFLEDALLSMAVLSQHPWFERAWIVQEVVCAPNTPTYLFGFRRLSWKALISLSEFCDAFSDHHRIGLRQELLDISFGNLGILGEVSEFCHIATDEKKLLEIGQPGRPNTTAGKLNMLLEMTGGAFKASDPRDVLYALLGLLGMDDIPEELLPDYGLPVSQVFERYTVYLVEYAKYIGFLDTCTKQMSDAPSWVPDWTSRRLGYLDGAKPSRVCPLNVSILIDRRTLLVEGVMLDKVVSVIFPTNDDASMTDHEINKDKASATSISEAYRLLKQGCLKAWVESYPGKTYRTFESHWIRLWAPISKEWLDLDLFEFMEGEKDPGMGETERQFKVSKVRDVMKRICTTGLAILAGEGLADILQVDKTLREGDIMCMMKGLKIPCMLRPEGENFQFVSTCGRTSFQVYDPDEDFYRAAALKTFALV